MKKTHQYGVMLVLIGATLWGSSSNSLEYLMTYQHFSWDTVLAIRMFVTAAVFLLISGLRGEKLLEPVKKDFFRLIRFTVLGLYTMQVPFTIAIHYSNAATGTVLQYLMPVILLGYYLILERRRPHRRAGWRHLRYWRIIQKEICWNGRLNLCRRNVRDWRKNWKNWDLSFIRPRQIICCFVRRMRIRAITNRVV